MLIRPQDSQLPHPPLETGVLAKVPETYELPRRYRLWYSPSKDPFPTQGMHLCHGTASWPQEGRHSEISLAALGAAQDRKIIHTYS